MKKCIKVILYVCMAVVLLAAVELLVDGFIEHYTLKLIDIDVRRAIFAPMCAALTGGFIFVKRHYLD